MSVPKIKINARMPGKPRDDEEIMIVASEQRYGAIKVHPDPQVITEWADGRGLVRINYKAVSVTTPK